MKRINTKMSNRIIDDNKLYISEILSILLENDENAEIFGKLGGINTILIALSVLKLILRILVHKNYIYNYFLSHKLYKL